MSARPIAITVSLDPDAPAFDRRGEPVSIGVSLAQGRAFLAASWTLRDEDGLPHPVQTTPLDRWSDGSVRWLLVEFFAHASASRPSLYFLAEGEAQVPVVGAPAVDVINDGPMITIDTMAARFSLPRQGDQLLAAAQVDGKEVWSSSTIEA